MKDLCEDILNFWGEDGLKIAAEAPGRSKSLRYNIQLKMGCHELIFGTALLQFLELVNRTNSIQAACRQAHISYDKGLKMIELAEKEAGLTLLERHTDGSKGGISFLTPAGKNFIVSYVCMKGELEIYAEKLFEQYFKDRCVSSRRK